jgi:hypothetical protein
VMSGNEEKDVSDNECKLYCKPTSRYKTCIPYETNEVCDQKNQDLCQKAEYCRWNKACYSICDCCLTENNSCGPEWFGDEDPKKAYCDGKIQKKETQKKKARKLK